MRRSPTFLAMAVDPIGGSSVQLDPVWAREVPAVHLIIHSGRLF